MEARPMNIGLLNPLIVPVGNVVLIAILEDVIEGLQEHMEDASTTPQDMVDMRLMLAQRVEFLKWLRDQPGPNIGIAMYPAETEVFTTCGLVS